jgi:predicted amidophosphoribosyltransferase
VSNIVGTAGVSSMEPLPENGGRTGSDCTVCGSRAAAGFDHCYCCGTIQAQLGSPLAPVATTTDYVVGDANHRLLRGYKDGPTPALCDLRARAVARRVGGWLDDHADVVASWLDRCDVVTAVPSSHRGGVNPAGSLAGLVPQLAARYRPLLERGPAPVGHLRAARNGFVVAGGVDGDWLRRQRALVFDDSLTTGARAQSAAFALRRAGAAVVGILAVGRACRRTGRRGSSSGPDVPPGPEGGAVE